MKISIFFMCLFTIPACGVEYERKEPTVRVVSSSYGLNGDRMSNNVVQQLDIIIESLLERPPQVPIRHSRMVCLLKKSETALFGRFSVYLLIYHSTVLTIPVSNVSSARQPSSVSSFVASIAYLKSCPARSATNVICSA